MNISYNHYKSLYESVKPIRGRAEEVRPIGNRRRDWETIRMDGDVVECVLYQTPVVRYYPDGSVGFRCGGWVTPSTAEFMHAHSPLMARKKSNRIWVRPNRESTEYPLASHDEARFKLTTDNKWVPDEPIVITKKVINRQQAKEAREPYQKFLNFVDAFMKLSDGWVTEDTRAAVGTLSTKNWGDRYDFGVGEVIYRRNPSSMRAVLDLIQESDEDDYLRAMCALLQHINPKDQRYVRTDTDKDVPNISRRIYDLQYDRKAVRAKLYRMVEACQDVFDEVEVEYK
jgi:hypothetical protein